MADVVRAFRRGEEGQRARDQLVDAIKTAGPRGAQERFEFRKRLFDRIEVGGGNGGRNRTLRADGLDCRLHLRLFVYGQIIEDDDVAALERGHQHLFDVGEEARIIDRAIEDGRGGEPLQTQARR